MDDATYAPQSPDLTSYYSNDTEPVHPQHQQYRGSVSHTLTPFTPTDAQSPFAHAKFGGPGAQSYFPQQPIPQQRPLPGAIGAPAGLPIFRQDIFPKRESNGAGDDEWDSMAPSTRKKIKGEVKEEEDFDAGVGNGHPGVDVRTKFPVARIKRIMQSDEDVGKVAQVTPVVVSKALELFMIDLVTSAASEAKSRTSKRVTAAHLKQAVMTNEKYRDWLGETVSKVADAAAASGGGKAPKDEDSDEWADAAAATKKKRGGGRRKKKDDDM